MGAKELNPTHLENSSVVTLLRFIAKGLQRGMQPSGLLCIKERIQLFSFSVVFLDGIWDPVRPMFRRVFCFFLGAC
jgi:hypothetical protein